MKYQQYHNPLHILGHIEANYLTALDFPQDHSEEILEKYRSRLSIISPFLNRFDGFTQLQGSDLVWCCQIVADLWDN